MNRFALVPFRNAGGGQSWRITGWLHGVRIRKNFKRREDAAAEKATLEIKAAQVAGGMRPVLTTLSDVRVREAERAFDRIASLPRKEFILDCLRIRLGNFKDIATL